MNPICQDLRELPKGRRIVDKEFTEAKNPIKPSHTAKEQAVPLSLIMQTSLLTSSFFMYPFDPIDPKTMIEKI